MLELFSSLDILEVISKGEQILKRVFSTQYARIYLAYGKYMLMGAQQENKDNLSSVILGAKSKNKNNLQTVSQCSPSTMQK
jgi:hypothetical protein